MTSHIAAKLIKSLHQKKHRQATKKFLIEGGKNVLELLESSFQIEAVYVTPEFKKAHAKLLERHHGRVFTVDASELDALGTLEHNHDALAIAFQKSPETIRLEGVILALDDIRDPGNLGTLIRIADWYGITQIVCSSNCVDWYNPKVISATMGSFTRVTGVYTNLEDFLARAKVPVLGAFLDGTSVHTYTFPQSGILVVGSESHGISNNVGRKVTDRVTIPRFGKAESLNAAVAGAIILDRWQGARS